MASWSSIDFYGNWKALHYRARDLYDPKADLKLWQQYYKTYPKDLHLKAPKYKVEQHIDRKGRLSVTVSAQTLLRDVMLQTEPHVDGHFDHNYFDLGAKGTFTAHFIPRNPKEDLSEVKVTARTLNELYNR